MNFKDIELRLVSRFLENLADQEEENNYLGTYPLGTTSMAEDLATEIVDYYNDLFLTEYEVIIVGGYYCLPKWMVAYYLSYRVNKFLEDKRNGALYNGPG